MKILGPAEGWVAEIKLRAVMRIGELSRELETAKPVNGKGAGLPSGGKTKAQTLKTAGISTSAAHRAEQIGDAIEILWPSRSLAPSEFASQGRSPSNAPVHQPAA